MKIKNLRAGLKNVTVKATVVRVSPVKTVRGKWGPVEMRRVLLEDETGSIVLVLWGDLVNKCREKDEVTLRGVQVIEYGEELQLKLGKSGRLKVKGVELPKEW